MTKLSTAFVYKLLIVTVTSVFLNGLNAIAQWPGYKVFPLNEDNRAIKINTLFKSNEGYIYTGTTNGLYKFDGTRFSKIYFENKDYADTVTAVFQDKSNKYWIGFNNGRIAHIINGKLVYYNPEEGTPVKKSHHSCRIKKITSGSPPQEKEFIILKANGFSCLMKQTG